MKKMPCLFVRNFGPKHTFTITEAVTPGCEWVLAGEGTASRKWDGSACLVQGGKLFARFDAKKGKAPPAGAIPCEPAADPVTGHWPHWVPVDDSPAFRWHREAFAVCENPGGPWLDGTYELVGPKVNGGNDGLTPHALVRHGADVLTVERTFAGLRAWLSNAHIEGLVFAHPDGRMAKIRRDDFGFRWPDPELKASIAEHLQRTGMFFHASR